MIAKGAYDNPVPEMYYESCVKENCAWWIKIEVMTNVREAAVHGHELKTEDKGHCAIALLGIKSKEELKS